MAAAAALAILAVAVAGCAKPAQPRTFTVTIAQMAYGPTPPSMRVGDSIKWVNADILQHTATAKDGSFDVDLPPKATATTRIAHAGTVDFYCRYHPGMTGRLSVAG
ncbi:MAG: amicyanin [Phenylobacterium sp.]|nr:MAG: amicyanin [Phenylobacterium sp.]